MTVHQLPGRVTMRDPSLPHQIVLRFAGNDIAVSCNCMKGADGNGSTGYAAFEMRAHLDEEGDR